MKYTLIDCTCGTKPEFGQSIRIERLWFVFCDHCDRQTDLHEKKLDAMKQWNEWISPWRPIKTAPKDRVIDLYCPGLGRMPDCQWRADTGKKRKGWRSPAYGVDDETCTHSTIPTPSHWMEKPGKPLGSPEEF